FLSVRTGKAPVAVLRAVKWRLKSCASTSLAAVHESGNGTSRRFALTHQSGRFSNRPAGVKHFQAIHTSVSMSLTGSCFSPDSAPRPFHHGIRDEVVIRPR